jgi:hypothetical protein
MSNCYVCIAAPQGSIAAVGTGQRQSVRFLLWVGLRKVSGVLHSILILWILERTCNLQASTRRIVADN